MRLHHMPHLPVALLIDSTLKRVFPFHLFRSSQHARMLSLVPTAASLLDTQLDSALVALLGGRLRDGNDGLWQFGIGSDLRAAATASAAAVLKGPPADVLAAASRQDSASGCTAVGIAHAISALALSTELLRLLMELVPLVLQPRAGGQSILSKVAAFDVAIKAWLTTLGEWMIENRSELRAAQAAAQAVALTAGDRLNDILERKSRGYAGAAMPPRSPRRPAATAIVRMMQLVHVAEVHVRRFHSALCKCVHHPTTRYHRARVASAPPIDSNTGCVLTPQSRVALALVVHGTQLTMAAAVDEAFPATMRMLSLHTLAVEARGLLFEDRRREFFSLCGAYMLHTGVVRLALARLADASRLAMEVLRASAERSTARAVDEASDRAAAAAAVPAQGDAMLEMDIDSKQCSTLADEEDEEDTVLEDIGPPSSTPTFRAADTAVHMLSGYLALLALCVSRQRMLSQASHTLLAASLPAPEDMEVVLPASASPEASVAVLHNDALVAALDLWQVLTSEPGIVPLPLISHLAAVLMLAAVSASDVPPAVAPPIPAAGSRAAALRSRRSGEGGGAGTAVAAAFEPSESVVTALGAMGFDGLTARFAMDHLRSNDTATVVDFCLENDIAAMRATAATVADTAAKAASDAAPAEQPVAALLAGESDMLTQRLCMTLRSGVGAPLASSAAASTYAQSSNAAGEASCASQASFGAPTLRFERVPVATVADGILRFCKQAPSGRSSNGPPAAFVLQPLFGQLMRDAPLDAAVWLQGTLIRLFEFEV
jgi:hypothetical protein